MTSKQIETLVESVENRMYAELGEYTRIEILGYVSGDYDVQFQWEAHGTEHSEIVANNLTDDELEYFLENDVYSYLRDFYYRMRNGGMTLYDTALMKLGHFIASCGGCLPGDVEVDIRWKDSGEVQKEMLISTSKSGYKDHAEHPEDDAESWYFFYCNGIQEFLNLLHVKNGEDFEIIEIHRWD